MAMSTPDSRDSTGHIAGSSPVGAAVLAVEVAVEVVEAAEVAVAEVAEKVAAEKRGLK